MIEQDSVAGGLDHVVAAVVAAFALEFVLLDGGQLLRGHAADPGEGLDGLDDVGELAELAALDVLLELFLDLGVESFLVLLVVLEDLVVAVDVHVLQALDLGVADQPVVGFLHSYVLSRPPLGRPMLPARQSARQIGLAGRICFNYTRRGETLTIRRTACCASKKGGTTAHFQSKNREKILMKEIRSVYLSEVSKEVPASDELGREELVDELDGGPARYVVDVQGRGDLGQVQDVDVVERSAEIEDAPHDDGREPAGLGRSRPGSV